MPSGFFCLLRFYLRVDNTLIRVIDTRFHYEEGNNYILREYTERESRVEDLNVSRECFMQDEPVQKFGFIFSVADPSITRPE